MEKQEFRRVLRVNLQKLESLLGERGIEPVLNCSRKQNENSFVLLILSHS